MGAQGPEQQKEPRYQVIDHTYLTSGAKRWACNQLKIHVCETQPANFHHFLITSCSHEKRYQPLHAFPYWKRWKAGWYLGTRLNDVISTECLWICWLFDHPQTIVGNYKQLWLLGGESLIRQWLFNCGECWLDLVLSANIGTPAKAVVLTVAGRIVATWLAGYRGTKTPCMYTIRTWN